MLDRVHLIVHGVIFYLVELTDTEMMFMSNPNYNPLSEIWPDISV